MSDFNSKCFKCVAEQQKNGAPKGAAGILFGKMQQGLVGGVDDEIFVCAKHSK
ncbi:hypothetical protein SSABA_v1c01920 [Spiroplasma sabaudiense Ar-1343]|uniref:Uncharacterized protein n=1 Tax=Spiroplasma sabaudiense Ar-1343 TaxID=1276257 RepID=W6AIS1_9MOLU|nr:hypothetical protein [Spiroplasma sabaudiense]AHI53604.1 hypothetical protein SSABA_v1c01920 [Spiroplasma sabaudiense Ar-1343]